MSGHGAWAAAQVEKRTRYLQHLASLVRSGKLAALPESIEHELGEMRAKVHGVWQAVQPSSTGRYDPQALKSLQGLIEAQDAGEDLIRSQCGRTLSPSERKAIPVAARTTPLSLAEIAELRVLMDAWEEAIEAAKRPGAGPAQAAALRAARAAVDGWIARLPPGVSLDVFPRARYQTLEREHSGRADKSSGWRVVTMAERTGFEDDLRTYEAALVRWPRAGDDQAEVFVKNARTRVMGSWQRLHRAGAVLPPEAIAWLSRLTQAEADLTERLESPR